MAQIPKKLIDSLVELGLLDSEAKIYAALVLYQKVRIRDLHEALDLSRPSIYAGLRSLDELGLVDLICANPATYQVVPPELALDILTIMHRKAKEKALALFRELGKENNSPLAPDMWRYVRDDDFEARINDMLDSALRSVFCFTSGKYLDLIEKRAKSDLDFHFVIISEDRVLQEGLQRVFKKRKTSVRTLRKSSISDTLINHFPSVGPDVRQYDPAFMLEKMEVFTLDSMFLLNVDDREVFVIPPMPPDSVSGGMITTNKSLIMYQKLMIQMLIDADTRS